MKRYLLPLALLALAGVASAATVTTSWTNPTTNTDGSAIPATGAGSLTQARIEYGTCNGALFGVKAGEVVRPMPVTTATLNLQPGTTCVRVKVTNTYANESAASNVATRVIDAPTPSPPTNLTVSEPTAYDVRPNESTFAFERGRVVGKCKIGAACDEDRTTGDGYFALERPSKCTRIRESRSVALVAKCS